MMKSIFLSLCVCLLFISCKQAHPKKDHIYNGPGDETAIVVSTEGAGFQDDGNLVKAEGSWLKGTFLPRNKVQIIADQKTMTLTLAYAALLDFTKPAMLACEAHTYKITQWSPDTIVTEKVGGGNSGHYSQIVIDRKAKKVREIFSGERPATIELGDGLDQFKHPEKYEKHYEKVFNR